MNERDLVSGCQKNDNACRRLLYERYAKIMLGICFRYTGDISVAEDLLHDGFIRIFETIHSFNYRGEGSLKAWISRIFINLALAYLRKACLTESLSPEALQEENQVSEEDLETIPLDVLMRFITELPTGYRTVFNLNTFEEMSHKEIAETLQINESSSRSQLSRAKTILAEKVNNYVNEKR